jgi:hypothetical protein
MTNSNERTKGKGNGRRRAGRNGNTRSGGPPEVGKPNGRQLPTVAGDAGLDKKTDDELWAVANGGAAKILGVLRKTVIPQARLVGAALLELKWRMRDGTQGWTDCLRANYEGSVESAGVYMRVAEHWHLVDGWLRTDPNLTLDQVRWLLSEGNRPPPGARKRGKDDSGGGGGDGSKDGNDGKDGDGDEVFDGKEGDASGTGTGPAGEAGTTPKGAKTKPERKRPGTGPADPVADDNHRVLDFGVLNSHLIVTVEEKEAFLEAADRLRARDGRLPAAVAYRAILAAAEQLPAPETPETPGG